MRSWMVVPVLVLAACASDSGMVTTTPLPAADRAMVPPATNAEDLFPLSGSADYDVERYDLDLSYDPASTAITATVVLTAVALADLPLVSVDLGVMAVDGATVDGAAVAGAQLSSGKLRLTPAAPVAKGARFVLAVAYHGVPEHRSDPSLGTPIGWVSTSTGAYTRNEPDGASSWLPSNDHPSDKAAYRVRVTVPEPYFAVANGAGVAEDRANGSVATTWEMVEPMATSEVEIAVGQLVRVDSTSPAGSPLTSYVDANGGDASPGVGLAGQMLDYYSGLFGPYPFAAAGVIGLDGPIGSAVPAQSRPVLSAADLTGRTTVRQQGLLSAALAHQWFGSAVTPARWQDIWLSEGFATYARWLWMEQAGLQRVDDAAANALVRSDSLRAAYGPPSAPSVATLYGPAVVDGGAVVLHALRQTVGDDMFFAILRTWVAKYAGTSVTTDTFIDHASTIAGEDLTGFFLTWLSATDVPDDYPNPPS